VVLVSVEYPILPLNCSYIDQEEVSSCEQWLWGQKKCKSVVKVACSVIVDITTDISTEMLERPCGKG
jgi:hypothetical protein